MHKSEDYVLEEWVRKQIENKENPDVIKIVIKNRGSDPKIVDSVISALKGEAEKKEAIKKDIVRKDKDQKVKPKTKKQQPTTKEKPPKMPEKISNTEEPKMILPEKTLTRKTNILSGLMSRITNIFALAASVVVYALRSIFEHLARIHVSLPNAGSLPITGRMLGIIAITAAILIFLLLISYGINEYADNMAKGVVG